MPITFAWRDASGSPGASRLYLANSVSLADANTKASGLATLLLAASDCTILGYNIGYPMVNTTPAAPGAGSRVENRAVFSFRTDAGKVTRVTVPGIKAASVHPSGGIDSTEASIAAVIADILGGGWTDSNGIDIVSLVKDAQVFSQTSQLQYTSDTSPDS